MRLETLGRADRRASVLEGQAMSPLARLRAPTPPLAMVALPLAVGDDDSGSRTLVGVAIVLVIIAIVCGIGLMMTRSARG
jgi:hypothetical protein